MKRRGFAFREWQRQRRLRQYRRDDPRIEHHRQSEISSETHPNHANTLAADLIIGMASEGPQPVDDRARPVLRQHVKLAANAGTSDLAEGVGWCGRFSGDSEQMWHENC